jgi:hypothetical protein
MDGKIIIPRRRFKQTLPLKERLLKASRDAKERAAMLPTGPERQSLLSTAREAKLAAELEDWLSSPGLRPPR